MEQNFSIFNMISSLFGNHILSALTKVTLCNVKISYHVGMGFFNFLRRAHFTKPTTTSPPLLTTRKPFLSFFEINFLKRSYSTIGSQYYITAFFAFFRRAIFGVCLKLFEY